MENDIYVQTSSINGVDITPGKRYKVIKTINKKYKSAKSKSVKIINYNVYNIYDDVGDIITIQTYSPSNHLKGDFWILCNRFDGIQSLNFQCNKKYDNYFQIKIDEENKSVSFKIYDSDKNITLGINVNPNDIYDIIEMLNRSKE